MTVTGDLAEILAMAEAVYDGWYADTRIDWENFLDRLDGSELEDGSQLDLGNDMSSPLIEAIQRHIRAYAKL